MGLVRGRLGGPRGRTQGADRRPSDASALAHRLVLPGCTGSGSRLGLGHCADGQGEYLWLTRLGYGWRTANTVNRNMCPPIG